MVFSQCMTQWQVGPAGLVGLRYEVLPFMLRLAGVPRARWPEVVADIQTLEIESLRLLREKR